MDLLVIISVLVLAYVALNIRPSKEGDIVFSVLILIMGLFVAQEGLVFNSTALTVVNTPMNFVLLTFLTLGGLMSLYSSIIGYRSNK